MSAVVLNLIFNGVKSEKKAQCEIRKAGHDFDGRGGMNRQPTTCCVRWMRTEQLTASHAAR
jgi:hypothetical protein